MTSAEENTFEEFEKRLKTFFLRSGEADQALEEAVIERRDLIIRFLWNNDPETVNQEGDILEYLFTKNKLEKKFIIQYLREEAQYPLRAIIEIINDRDEWADSDIIQACLNANIPIGNIVIACNESGWEFEDVEKAFNKCDIQKEDWTEATLRHLFKIDLTGKTAREEVEPVKIDDQA